MVRVCVAGGVMYGRGCAWQGHAWQRGMRGRGVCVAGETVTAVGGMHPTGMHSCSFTFYFWYQESVERHHSLDL